MLAVWFYRRLALRIKRSERDFHDLLEAAPFAIVVTRRETGEFLFANRKAIELLGLPATDYRSYRVPYANSGADRDRMLRALEKEGRATDMEMKVTAFNGRHFPVLGSVVPITFGGVDALIGAVQDISKLKEAETAIRASEARLRAVFESAPDGIIIIDPDGAIRQASDSCATLLGRDNSTNTTKLSILDFLPEPERPFALELIAKVLREQLREPIAYQITRPDGSKIWIEPRGIPVPDPVTGRPTIVLVLRNITKRREAQELQAAHAAKLQDALNRIAHLQNEIVRVCAWTKQVNVDGKWIPIDHYLAKHLGLKISHGISEEGLAILGVPPEPLPPEPDR